MSHLRDVQHPPAPFRQPIDEVVAWSRTARGGRQLTLIDEPLGGCARWGLCEGKGGAS